MAHFNLITWNIQWGRGCDGVVNLQRIVDTARGLADFDVLCLQEVASNYPGLAGSAGEDQPAVLAQALPGYASVFGIATDVLADDGSRRLFGNMILSRLPLVQVFRHLLPWPADPGKKSMQRVLVETVIDAPFGALRVMTTHLEYYSALQRAAQVERIRELHSHATMRSRAPDPATYVSSGGPFDDARHAAPAILTGDFNFRPDDLLHERIATLFGEDVAAFHDAWQICNPGVPHPPSVGLFDREQWPDGGFCCDFVYVTEDLRSRFTALHVDQETRASDHQPLLLTLDAGAR